MAKFCKYCGTQLEDGQVCSCPQAQAELAAPAAAPAPEAAAPVATAAPAAAPSAGKDLLNKVKETFLSYLKAPKATTAKIAADPKGMTLAGIFAGVNALAVFLYLWKILGGIMGMAGDISGGLTDKIDIEYPIFQMLIAGIVIAAVGILISTLVVLLMCKVGKQAVDFKKLLVIESVNTIFPSMVLLAGTVLGFLGGFGMLLQILAVAFLWIIWFLNCGNEARDLGGADVTEKGKNMWIMVIVMLVGYGIAMWAFSALSLWSVGELKIAGYSLSEGMDMLDMLGNLGDLF